MRERFSADPTIVFISSVIEDLRLGKLQIPRFQRPLVWGWEQRRDLLSSIYEGLPIGALMIWQTDDSSVGAYDRLGPYPLPPPSPGERRFLMDGVQRVSTLFGALSASDQWAEYDEDEDASAQDFVVYADLDAVRDSDRFLRRADIPSRQLRDDPSRYLPLSVILDSRELLRFQRAAGDVSDARVDAADVVATAFRSYKIPLITLKSASLELVTKSFERVNSRGAPMSELHMLNALSYSPEFHLLRRERELRHEMLAEVGWQDVHRDVVLRCLKLSLGTDLYAANPDEVSHRLKQSPAAFDRVFEGIRSCAQFFSEVIGVSHEAMVPYRMQTVALAFAMTQADWRVNAQDFSDWFWLTTYTEAFGSSARQSENALNDFIRFFQTGHFVWSLRQDPTVRPLLGAKLNIRSVRGKALAFALNRRARETMPTGLDLLEEYGRDAFSNMPFFPEFKGRAGLRFLVPPGQITGLAADMVVDVLNPEQKEQHFLSDEALEHLNRGDQRAFVEAREIAIFQYEMEQLFGPAAGRLGQIIQVRGAAGHSDLLDIGQDEF